MATELVGTSPSDTTDCPSGNQCEGVFAGDWQQWCRLCAKEDQTGNISIFLKNEQQTMSNVAPNVRNLSGELNLVEAIEKYFWIKIERDENLPEMLCTECFSLLTTLVTFLERVSKVEEMYQSLKNSTPGACLNVREKYGLTVDQQQHELFSHPMPEVHYFDEKPKLNQLGAEFFTSEAGARNPLAQSRVKLKIKKEDDDIMEDEELIAIDGECGDVNSDHEFFPIASTENDTSSEDELDKDKRRHKKMKNIKKQRYNSPIEENENRKKAKEKKRKHTELRNDEENTAKDDTALNVFPCAECPRKFLRVQHYRRHMQVVHAKIEPQRELLCPQCSMVFTTQWKFDKHVRGHLPPELKKNSPCPYCEKKFTSTSNMQIHIRYIHMDERPFICEECGTAVRTKATLKQHMLTHTDDTPFECEICKKGFKEKPALKRHMEIHDPNKPVCAECGLQLSSRVTLNRHLLVHSNKMHHKCDYCGRAFKRAKALKNHLILHTGLKPYSCDFCDRTFASGSNCRSHKKKAHPEELAALEAAGGGKPYTRNIPKLEALKAVTKTAENLEPVVSKQSGHFAFGKPPKQQLNNADIQ